METKIRLLKEQDIPACLKIILETKASCNKKEAKRILTLALKKRVGFINPDYYVLLLDNPSAGSGRRKIVVVSGLYYDYEDPKDIFWMDYFAISPKLQGQGFGAMLLKNLENICKEHKVRLLCVFAETEQAVNFYQKNGFKIFGKLDDYYGADRPRIWLSKNL